MQFQIKNQNFQIPKNAHLPLTLILCKFRKMNKKIAIALLSNENIYFNRNVPPHHPFDIGGQIRRRSERSGNDSGRAFELVASKYLLKVYTLNHFCPKV